MTQSSISSSLVRASVVLLTYNQEAFVQEALQSLLDQDIDDLEIVVSDDASHDGTWRVVTEMVVHYPGPKRLLLNQNATNIGLTANYEAAFALTTGDVVFSAAGDDVSTPDRCSACVALWLANDRAPDLIATDAYDMALDGEVLGTKHMDELQGLTLEEWAVKRPYQFGATHMLSRRLLAVNPLAANVPAEDQCFLVRAVLMGGGLRLNAPKVFHRRSGMSGKVREKSFVEKLANMRKGATRGLLELAQMQRDAACLGQAARFDALTQETADLYRYILAQLDKPGLLKSWALLRDAKSLRFSKKLRFFLYANLSWWFSMLFQLKVALNG
jgi:glycosyltransferase involved in cell wall biosynthesis